MAKIMLYPTASRFKRKKQEFGKKRTVPNQSMSLQEIIRRFIRKEALPLEKEVVFEDRFGDLEKLSREDITVRRERAEELKQWADRSSKAYQENERLKAEEKKKKEEEDFKAKVKAMTDKTNELLNDPDKPNG